MKRIKSSNKPGALHPELRKILRIPKTMTVSEVLKAWRLTAQQACKPCWELKYCPYGPFVEESPLLPDIPREDIPQEILETECSVFGHICPVLFVAEEFTETAKGRRRGRYISFKTKIRVVRRDNHTCQSCGKHLRDDEVEFDDFKRSIATQRAKLKEFTSLRIDSCPDEQYINYLEDLKGIYYGLKVSISDATIVAHSKTLAHILPNLIPPIDRQYTIRFFTQDNKEFFTESGKYRLVNLPKGIEAQFNDFKKYACRMKALFNRCDRQLFTINKTSFNTSYPKIMDNLIMAFVKDVPKPRKQ